MTEESSSRPRKAAGPDRPAYFDHADVDKVMAIVLALASEVGSIRERLDTHERIAAGGSPPAKNLVEAYLPGPQEAAERDAWQAAYIRRLFRVITEDIEALRAAKTPAAAEPD